MSGVFRMTGDPSGNSSSLPATRRGEETAAAKPPVRFVATLARAWERSGSNAHALASVATGNVSFRAAKVITKRRAEIRNDSDNQLNQTMKTKNSPWNAAMIFLQLSGSVISPFSR